MDQYCAKCRTLIRSGSVRCAKCGELAGEVFDGRIRKPDRKGGGGFFSTLLVLLALTGAYWWWSNQQKLETTREASTGSLPSTLVVRDRPGGARTAPGADLNEAEAIRRLQRYFVEDGKTLDCLVISSQGFRDGAWRLTARDRCQSVRLGLYAVEGTTGRVSPGT